MLNTLLAAAIGIVVATLLGFLVGVMRLSRNYLVSRIATVYVETLRNVPLLVQLLFWYVAISKLFPGVRQAINPAICLSAIAASMRRAVAVTIRPVLIALLVASSPPALHPLARRRQMANGSSSIPSGWGSASASLLPLLVGLHCSP